MIFLNQTNTIYLAFAGAVILIGLLFGKLAKKIRVPNVTGYLVGGLIMGPILKLLTVDFLSSEVLDALDIIPQIALGFIAFTIGSEFRISYFKKVGAKPLIIAIFESFLAIIAVLVVLIILKVTGVIEASYEFIIILSAIAAATAPAATLMVIKQYKARGEVTENLMSVVALDDATAIIFFGLMVAVAQMSGTQSSNIAWSIAKPFVEIIASLVVGSLIGIIFTLLIKWFTGRGNRISVVISMILITVALGPIIKTFAPDFEFSTLLSCMMIGAVFTNLAPEEDYNKVMELVDRVTPPILIMFFVISGAELNLTVLTTVGIMGAIYIIFRVVGKVVGSYVGAVISKSSPAVRKYLGFALIPQAGVAIGLTIAADAIIPEHAPAIRAIILCGTLIYELLGPFITKYALIKAGEIELELPKKKELVK
ncbi:MAG: cation:proton antiporter [Bacilli bacterium]|nr:cation:proton antiporter [Bacilli bacterium]